MISTTPVLLSGDAAVKFSAFLVGSRHNSPLAATLEATQGTLLRTRPTLARRYSLHTACTQKLMIVRAA